ncbi:MAG: threonine-phosphate decarboxylase CobD [Cellulosilyticaceae bacterium]
MTELIHGGDIYSASQKLGLDAQEMIDFSANINPLGLPKQVEDAIIKSLPMCQHYPDPLCRDLVSRIAEHEQVTSDQVLCGNGAADLIYRFIRAIKPQRALLLAPTFAEYELALRTVGCAVSYYDLSEAHGFKVQEDYLSYIVEDLEMVILCNPNNPTGTLLNSGLLEAIIAKCEALNIPCMIDECFNDFLENKEQQSCISMIEDCQQLILLKAFTKIYAMPGIRLGYVLSSNSLWLQKMREEGQCWGVSVIAQRAGQAALECQTYLEQTKMLIATERQYLKNQLRQLGMTVFDSTANYIFFKNLSEVPIDKLLYQQGILIRSCSNYRGLDAHYYRVAVKTHSDNQKLMQSLERILSTWQNHL